MSIDEAPPTPEEKRKAHFVKTKRAVLKLAADQGGSASLAEMHALSESRYFVAHPRFSLLVEECVAEGLIEVEDHEVSLTAEGEAFAAPPD